MQPCRPLFGEQQLQAALQQLRTASLLGRHPRDPPSCEALHYIGRVPNPAADISLRTIDPERFVIYNAADACVLEEIEANMAFYEIYDGAIYMYQVSHDTQCSTSGLLGYGLTVCIEIISPREVCCMRFTMEASAATCTRYGCTFDGVFLATDLQFEMHGVIYEPGEIRHEGGVLCWCYTGALLFRNKVSTARCTMPLLVTICCRICSGTG
jgi:hypothetical protein